MVKDKKSILRQAWLWEGMEETLGLLLGIEKVYPEAQTIDALYYLGNVFGWRLEMCRHHCNLAYARQGIIEEPTHV